MYGSISKLNGNIFSKIAGRMAWAKKCIDF